MLARSFTGLKNLLRYARYTVRAPAVMVPATISEVPFHRTMAVQNATTMLTTGESKDLTWRALSAASTVAWLAVVMFATSRSWRPNAFIARTDPRPSWTTSTTALCLTRTILVTSFTAFLKRTTNSSRNGVTPMAIRVKSQSSQNIRPSMKTMVRRSTTMPSVEEEAKLCTVDTSLVMVDIRVPLFALS